MKYRKTADKLAILRSEKMSANYKDSVVINRQLSNDYLKALLAVHNATELPARDTVIALNITLDFLMYPATNLISIQVDSSQTWLKNIRNNIFPCGNNGIDYLMNKFYLKKDAYYNYFNSLPHHGVQFKTDSNCYMNRLADRFNALYQQGVVSAFPQIQSSPSFSLLDSLNLNFKELTYGFNWGDCVAGCLYHRYWTFRVNNDCSVEYKGSFGDPIPDGLINSLSEKILSDNIDIYPNPTSDKINIQIKGAKLENYTITIVNAEGKVVYNKTSSNYESDYIDSSEMTNGLYLLRIETQKTVLNRKILIHRP